MTADPVRPQDTLRERLRDVSLERLCPTTCGYRISRGGMWAEKDGTVRSLHEQGGPCGTHVGLSSALADAVLPIVEEETARQLAALRDKVKALADEWDRDGTNPEFSPTTRVLSEHHAERLRALVEEPQGGER